MITKPKKNEWHNNFHSKKTFRSIAAFLALLLIVMIIEPVSVYAEQAVGIVINNKEIVFDNNYGFPFIDENNRTQVPFRLTLETIGAVVTYDADAKIASAVKNGIRIDVPIGEKYIIRNGEKILNDTTSRIISNRTYLPIRIVLEAFGANVSWDSVNFTVQITYVEEPNLFTRIPSKFDLRTQGKISGVKNQYATGACWAFASFGAIESLLLPKQTWDFSEDHLSLSHGFDLSQADGGNYVISLSYLTRWSGPVIEADDPFNDGINNSNAVVVKHIQEAQFIPNKDFTGIKIALMNYGALQTSIYLSDATLAENSPYYNSGNASYYYTGTNAINHDLVIVGWDDNYSKDNFATTPLHNGAFIVKNSYGTDFGQKGYFYISYEDKYIGTQNIIFTRVEDTTNYDKIYQSDWLGYIGQIGYGEDTAYMANVYDAPANEMLEAVSFYATDMNTNYEVYVVNGFASMTDFDSMKLLKRGHFDYAGYYTVDFETPIAVNGPFAIIVKITTPGSLYPVAAEFMKDYDWLKTVDITDGVGFMSYDGKNWERTENALEANICLKAFTVRTDTASVQGN